MKNAAKFAVIAGSALLLAMLAVADSGVNGNVKVLKAHQAPILLWADGGLPIPPPPTGLSTPIPANPLRADGGLPIPPPPTALSKTAPANRLRADGGLPIPPPPKNSFAETAVSNA